MGATRAAVKLSSTIKSRRNYGDNCPEFEGIGSAHEGDARLELFGAFTGQGDPRGVWVVHL